MKLRSWLKYFAYALTVMVLFFLNMLIFQRISRIQSLTYTISYVWMSVTILINMLLGALLGLEHLKAEAAKAGRWKLNLPKFIFLVLPSLYLSLSLILCFTSANCVYYPIFRLLSSSHYGLEVIPVSQIFFGYFMSTSVYKQTEISI
ncbi:MAG: hypothetical protein VB064_12320 [Oscillospiraceae bacterium]|nr:hypothetical protein [Oscillospiraceae bacterium]